MEKLTVLKRNKIKTNSALRRAIVYIQNPLKTNGGVLTGAMNCIKEMAYEYMMNTKRRFGKESDIPLGKYERRQGYHWKISFSETDINPDLAFQIVKEFAEKYLGEKGYEVVYAVHVNTGHIHGHIVYNSVNRITGKKYHDMRGDWAKEMTPVLDEICAKNGIALTRKKSEAKKVANEQKISWSQLIRRDLDALVILSPNFESLLSKLEGMGYEVHTGNRVHYTLRPPGMLKHRRFDTLGEDYTVERLKKRIRDTGLKNYAPEIMARTPYVKAFSFARFGKNRRPKLSGLRKKYFARLYRAGILKKRGYSQAWRYRDDIRHMKKLQEQYLFLSRHGISTIDELEVRRKENLERRMEVSAQKSSLYKQRSGFKELFDMLDEIDGLRSAENCYRRGETDFLSEHEKYSGLEKALEKSGYTETELRRIKEHYREQISGVLKKEAEARKEEKLLAAIEGDTKDKENRRDDTGHIRRISRRR